MRTSLVLISTLLLVVVTACMGEDRLSKSEYEQKVRSEYAQVQAAFRKTGAAYGTPRLAATIEGAQQQLREAADALEEAEPPKEVEQENEEIVEGMRRYADGLDRLRDAATRGDLKTIQAATDQISENEAVHQIAEAAEEMKFKGYDLGPIADE